jgi:hypothetical protein
MSLHNDLYSRMVIGQPEPEIGMGCSLLSHSDRHAASVIKVEGNVISVQRDHAKRLGKGGASESQEYEFSPNPRGAIYYFRRAKDGVWSEVYRNPVSGRWIKRGGYRLRLGERLEYYDYSF